MDQESQHAKTNLWMVSTLLLAGLVVGFGIAQIPYFKTFGGTQARVAALNPDPIQPLPEKQGPPPPPTLTAEQIAQITDDDSIIGSPTAPITFVEFSDYQCPYCGRFFERSLPAIEENYIAKGKVKLIYRDFPLDFHKQAQAAAEASECADDQGKFREMHDMLFAQQAQWSGNDKAVGLFKGYAEKIGMNAKQFGKCMETHKYEAEVRKDLIDGASIGVNGTPAFFINGKYVSGAMPYDTVFKPIFDAELEGKKWELQYDSLGKPSVKVY